MHLAIDTVGSGRVTAPFEAGILEAAAGPAAGVGGKVVQHLGGAADWPICIPRHGMARRGVRFHAGEIGRCRARLFDNPGQVFVRRAPTQKTGCRRCRRAGRRRPSSAPTSHLSQHHAWLARRLQWRQCRPWRLRIELRQHALDQPPAWRQREAVGCNGLAQNATSARRSSSSISMVGMPCERMTQRGCDCWYGLDDGGRGCCAEVKLLAGIIKTDEADKAHLCPARGLGKDRAQDHSAVSVTTPSAGGMAFHLSRPVIAQERARRRNLTAA